MDGQVEMRKLLEDWRRSGLSLREFGRRKGLGYAKLVYWRRKLRLKRQRSEVADGAQVADRWLPVRVIPSSVGADGTAAYEVRLANGLRVGVAAGFDAGELSRLMQVLASC